MSATADIQLEQITNAILVPSRAVQTSGTTKTVTVLRGAERQPVVVPVVTGLTSEGQTEISSSGDAGTQALMPGEVVVVSGTTTASTTNSTQNSSRSGTFGGPSPFGP